MSVRDTTAVSAMRRALVVILLSTTVLGLQPASAAAHSSLLPDKVDAIGTSDTVVTGDEVGVARSGKQTGWRIERDEAIDVAADAAVDMSLAGSEDSDTAEERQASSAEEGRSVTGPIVGVGLLLVVLVVGLQAIKRQRDEGRRSKLPPIG